jgi:hypothetical protein
MLKIFNQIGPVDPEKKEQEPEEEKLEEEERGEPEKEV